MNPREHCFLIVFAGLLSIYKGRNEGNFSLTYYQHPVTNAMSEGLNSKIQKIKSMACGFRNIENFKTAIYFRCGGLQLYPC